MEEKKTETLHVCHIKVILKRGEDEFPLNVSIILPILSYGRGKSHEMAWILELHSSSLFILCLSNSQMKDNCLPLHPFLPSLYTYATCFHECLPSLHVSAVLFVVSRLPFSPSPGVFHVLLDSANPYIAFCCTYHYAKSRLTGILRLCTLCCLTEGFTAFELCISLSTKHILSGFGESSREYWEEQGYIQCMCIVAFAVKDFLVYWREGK